MSRTTTPSARAIALGLAVALATAPSPWPAAASNGDDDCLRCHGDAELLATRIGSWPAARGHYVDPLARARSVHADVTCADCHEGIDDYPHARPLPDRPSCADCHDSEAEGWSESIHGRGAASCESCHGVHDVMPIARLGSDEDRLIADATCAGCHRESPAATGHADPHRGKAACHECHGAHTIRRADDALARISPARQVETCGACHDSLAATWRRDVHGQAVLAGEIGVTDLTATTDTAPACTGCHLAHPMRGPGDDGFRVYEIDRCAACHAEYGATSGDTYHTKAARLRSREAAVCSDCHGAHDILPAGVEGSRVHPDRLVATCGRCHAEARPSFVAFEAHPDPRSFDKNPQLFVSYVFMNVLLIGVLGVFGLHTLVWWIRIMIQRRRGLAAIERARRGAHETPGDLPSGGSES